MTVIDQLKIWVRFGYVDSTVVETDTRSHTLSLLPQLVVMLSTSPCQSSRVRHLSPNPSFEHSFKPCYSFQENINTILAGFKSGSISILKIRCPCSGFCTVLKTAVIRTLTFLFYSSRRNFPSQFITPPILAFVDNSDPKQI